MVMASCVGAATGPSLLAWMATRRQQPTRRWLGMGRRGGGAWVRVAVVDEEKSTRENGM